ncbi:DUF4416 family protein [bacterium]|nr:DUF4416 family protein [bacterium]
MGEPTSPQPVKLFTGVLCPHETILDDVRQQLEERFGEIDYVSDSFSFNLTDYYEPEMGPNIVRWFWSFRELIDPGILPAVKLFTNEVEKKFADGKSNRRVNLDPGYLDYYKMILASVKDRAQKIYLSQGIYADPTLYYLKGRWYPYDWSLPDFKPATYHPIFMKMRLLYRHNLRKLIQDSGQGNEFCS